VKRFFKELVTLLGPALDAARKAIDERDQDDLPASLRRIAAHSGRLTPPLAAKLVSEIDALEWLRADALDHLADDAGEASQAFLQREEGWWRVVADEAGTVRVRSAESRIRDLEQEDARLGEALRAAKEKLKQQRAAAKEEVTVARAEVKELRRRIAAEERRKHAVDSRAAERITELEQSLVDVQQEAAAAEAALVELGGRLRAQRRELADARRALEAGRASAVVRDPLAVARQLDLMAASVPHRAGEEAPAAGAPSAGDSAPFRLPAGIAPDRAESVQWLLDQDGVGVIVDGYNLLFHLEPGEFTTSKARRNLGDLMGRFVRNAHGDVSVVIVFDSTLPGARDTKWAGPGVVVRYAEAGTLADEEVVRLAAASPRPVAVISSDREVREDAGAVGALALWSEAFVEYFIGGRPPMS
jgi:hypothetical protein